MKKLFTFLLVAFATIMFFAQSSKGQTTYEIIYWDNHTHASNVPYCACDSIKCVPPAGATGVTWFAAGAPETYHGDTLVLASGFNGQVDCFFTGGVKNLRLRPLTTPILPSFAPTYMICGVETITLDAENYSQYAFNSYLWSNGATTKTITVGAGTYSVTISNVCGSIIHSTTITEFNPNAPDLGPDLTVCHGSTVVLDPGTGFSHYSWLPAITNDTILYANADGMYIVQTTNAVGGCVDRDTIIITHIFPYNFQELCMVSFDTISFKNQLSWNQHLGVGIDSIDIEKEISLGVWESVGVVANSTSTFIDMTSDPQTNSDSYRILVVDSCGNRSSASDVHTTITLLTSYTPGPDVMGFTWSHYKVNGALIAPNYTIYGIDANNIVHVIGTVSGSQNYYNWNTPNLSYIKFFIGFTLNCGAKTDYLVRSNYTTNPVGINENSLSDLIDIYPTLTEGPVTIMTDLTINEVKVYSLLGQELLTTKEKNFTIPYNGLCFIYIDTDQGTMKTKVFVY